MVISYLKVSRSNIYYIESKKKNQPFTHYINWHKQWM